MLDVRLGDTRHQGVDPDEPALFFYKEEYYWFMHPLFEQLAVETGQYIDLHGNAVFIGPQLAALGRMLAEVRRVVEAQPESFKVHTGTRLPSRLELYEVVERTEFLRFLDVWDKVITRAVELGRPIICTGD
jgi:hypothetical protein